MNKLTELKAHLLAAEKLAIELGKDSAHDVAGHLATLRGPITRAVDILAAHDLHAKAQGAESKEPSVEPKTPSA